MDIFIYASLSLLYVAISSSSRVDLLDSYIPIYYYAQPLRNPPYMPHPTPKPNHVPSSKMLGEKRRVNYCGVDLPVFFVTNRQAANLFGWCRKESSYISRKSYQRFFFNYKGFYINLNAYFSNCFPEAFDLYNLLI